MPTAPSFANFTQLSEPFIKNGKEYIKVKNEATGTIREVRWYSEKEYARLYGPKLKKENDGGFDMLKHARGFDKGYIVVICGDRPDDEPWLFKSVARFAVDVGWYIASEDAWPKDALPHLKYILLTWDEFRDSDDRSKKTADEIKKILNKKIKNNEWYTFDD